MLTTLDDLAKAIDPALLFADLVGPADPWQARCLRSTADRLLMLCARQLGKSTCVAVLALHAALYRAGSLVLIVSPTARQSGLLYRKIGQFWRQLGRPFGSAEESATSLILGNGSWVVSLPGSAETIRGFSGPRLILADEAAMIPDDVFAAISPMLAVSSGRLICLSTPYGQRGQFYEWWTAAATPWERITARATDCPRVRAEFLEEQRKILGDRWWRQEFCCSFESTIDQVFSTESVLGAFTSGERPLFAGGI